MINDAPELDLLRSWETGVMEILDREDAAFFEPVRRILGEITDSVRKRVEVFIPINGDIYTPEGSFLWGYLLENHQFLTLSRVVETASNGEMASTVEPGTHVGIRISKKLAA